MTRWHLYYFFQWFSLGTDFNLRVPLLRQSVLDYFRNRGMHHIITARQWSCGKVMVSYMSVHQSVFPQGDYPWCIGTHCTDPCPSPALYMGPQGPSLPLLLVTSGSHHWRPVQTCSLQYSPPVLTSGGRWSMSAVRILLEFYVLQLNDTHWALLVLEVVWLEELV